MSTVRLAEAYNQLINEANKFKNYIAKQVIFHLSLISELRSILSLI